MTPTRQRCMPLALGCLQVSPAATACALQLLADALLGGVTIEQNDMSTARRNVRRLMDDYSEQVAQVAQAAIAESSSLTASNYLHPIQSIYESKFVEKKKKKI